VSVAVGNQHAIRSDILPSVACHLYHIFPYYLINDTIFWKKVIEHQTFVLFPLHLLSETFLIRERTERGTTKNVYGSKRKVPLLLSDFNTNLIFWTAFIYILKYQISWKSVH